MSTKWNFKTYLINILDCRFYIILFRIKKFMLNFEKTLKANYRPFLYIEKSKELAHSKEELKLYQKINFWAP